MCGLNSYKEDWKTMLRRHQRVHETITEEQTRSARLVPSMQYHELAIHQTTILTSLTLNVWLQRHHSIKQGTHLQWLNTCNLLMLTPKYIIIMCKPKDKRNVNLSGRPKHKTQKNTNDPSSSKPCDQTPLRRKELLLFPHCNEMPTQEQDKSTHSITRLQWTCS